MEKLRGKSFNKGITLIALVITIIVLLILAGISIATLTGENGLLSKSNIAKTETEKENAKEKVKIAVMGSRDSNGINLEELDNNLRQVEGLTDILYKDSSIFANHKIEALPIDVVVDGYMFKIDESGNVTKKAPKPVVTHTISPETQVADGEKITITIEATIAEGTIDEIIMPDGSVVKNATATYEVTENDDYEFTVKGSNKEETTHLVEIKNGKYVEKFSDIYTKTDWYTDKNGNTARIPKGFAVGVSSNINKIENGLVITDKIDSNHYSIGDEFVWIPVNNSADFKRRDGWALRKVARFSK